MRKITYLLLFFVTLSFSQQRKIDSLKNTLIQKRYREKIETLLDISEQVQDPDSTIFYLNKALQIAKENRFDSIYPIQFGLSVANYIKGDLVTAKNEIKKGVSNCKYTKNPNATLGHINMLLGVFCEAENQVDSATYYYDIVIKSLSKDTSKKAKSILGSVYTNYANLYLKKGNYLKAITIYIKSIELSEKANDQKSIMIAYNNIGGCYKGMDDYDKALEYYLKALNIANKKNELLYIGAFNLSVGEIYSLKKNGDKAIAYFSKAEKILKKNKFNSKLQIVYVNFMQQYLEKNDIVKAIAYSKKFEKNVDTNTDDFTKTSFFLNKALIKKEMKKNNEALSILNKALYLAEKNNYLEIRKKIIFNKIKILKTLNKKEEIIPLYETYLQLKDSILTKQKAEKIAEIETKYQTEKKEKENLQLKAEKAQQLLALSKENKQKWMYATALLASLLFLGIGYYYYQKNKKQKLLVENLQKELHHRVKNNLGVIDSLIEDIKEEFPDMHFSTRLTDLQNRIDSINEVHKQLYATDDITNLHLKKYVEKLAENVKKSFDKQDIAIDNAIEDKLTLDVKQSFPLGLIINEFLTNTFKYAFPEKEKGHVTIDMQDKDDNYILSLSDNGIGLPKDLNIEELDSFGLQIMKLLTKQLKGSFNLKNENGVHITIEFPK